MNFDINDTNWHHLIYTYENRNEKVYIDGVLISTNYDASTEVLNYGSPFTIGAKAAPSFDKWNGKIDDVGIWNRVLSSQEITNLYNSCTVPSPTGNATQVFCSTPTPTVASLTATGTGIQWYDAAISGNLLASTTPLIDGTSYYASQTVNGCESSSRLAVTININTPTISASNSTICLGSNVTLQASSSYVPTNTNCNLPTDLLSGLVGYWPFCGNANDLSGSGNNGTVNGAILTSDRFGNLNNAYSFDGNDFIQRTNFNSILGSNEFTISLWAKQETNNGWILSFGQASDGNGFHMGTWGLGAYKLYSGFWKDGYLSWPTATINNQWRHIVITYSNDRIKQYVDNVMVSDQNSNYVTENILTGTLNFGRQLSPYNEYFTGKLDEISIWNRALNSTELTKLNRVGTTTYVWSTGETTSQIVVSPTLTTQYWVDVTTDGVTCRAIYTVTVNSTSSPTANTTQTFCANQSPTISNLTATGNSIKWYNLSVGGSELNSTILLQNGTTYYASQTVNGCESTTRTAVTVVINPNPAAPFGMATQIFCNSTPPTLNDIVLTGTAIKWYDAAGSSTLLPNSTLLVNNTTYYATQTINGCESTTRFAVTTLINNLQLTTTNSTICSGSSV